MDHYCSINSHKCTMLVGKVTIIGETLSGGRGCVGEQSVQSTQCFYKSIALLCLKSRVY